jgi:hypothetical protein
VVGRRRDLTEDVGGGEKWSPGAVSCWFKLDGVGAPSADESGAINNTDGDGRASRRSVMASKVMAAERRARAESAYEVVKVESGSCPRAPTCGIRTTGPHGMAETGRLSGMGN